MIYYLIKIKKKWERDNFIKKNFNAQLPTNKTLNDEK